MNKTTYKNFKNNINNQLIILNKWMYYNNLLIVVKKIKIKYKKEKIMVMVWILEQK